MTLLGLRSLVRLSKIKIRRERGKKKKSPCDFLIFPNLLFCSCPWDVIELEGGIATLAKGESFGILRFRFWFLFGE